MLLGMLTSTARKARHEAISLKDIGVCPPHKWDYKDFTNPDGTTSNKMFCHRCGPIQPIAQRTKMDY